MKNIDKILLILDLDETLIHATSEQLTQQEDFIVGDEYSGYYIVYKRPFLNEFLYQVKDTFELAIWSSASDSYVEKVVKNIIPDDIPLAFIWGRSRCTYRRNFESIDAERESHYEYIKPLKKLKSYGYNLKRMIIVDDTPFKCQNNYGNAVYPRPFMGDASDTELLLLAEYLNLLKEQKNIRCIEKRGWWNHLSNAKKRYPHKCDIL